jgi:signal transduction histidine kinase
MSAPVERGWHTKRLVEQEPERFHLSLWQKIGLQALLLCVPIGVLIGLGIQDQLQNIRLVSMEQEGAHLCGSLRAVMLDVVHLGPATIRTTGPRWTPAHLQALATGRTDLPPRWMDGISASRLHDQALRCLDAPTDEANRQALLAALATAIHNISNNSRMILDPEIDTYYLIDASTAILPDLARRLDTYLTLAGVTGADRPSPAQLQRLSALHGLIRADLGTLGQGLATALNTKRMARIPDHAEALQRQAAADALLETHWRTLQPALTGSRPTGDRVRAHLPAIGLTSIEAVVALDRAVDRALDEALRLRRQGLIDRFTLLAALIAAMLAASGGLFLVTLRHHLRVERLEVTRQAISDMLATADSLAAVAPALLQALLEALKQDVAGIWLVDASTRTLHCEAVSARAGVAVPALTAACLASTFPWGSGLPGRVWAAGGYVGVPDIRAASPSLPRGPAVPPALTSAGGFPLRAGSEILGTIDYFGPRARQPAGATLRLMAQIGEQIGQFILRKRLEDERAHLLAVVSHDLRNPLNAITLATRVLAKDLAPAGTPVGQPVSQRPARMVALIESSAGRMVTLIRDLLDVSQIRAGRLQVRPTPLDAVALLQEVAAQQGPLAEEKALHLTVAPAAVPLMVMADHDRLLQVFGNLIGNALSLTPADGTITVGAEADGAMVRFWVADTGPGIPDSEITHLFERYWQGVSGRRSGVGLGLTIVKGIVESHGGHVAVASTVGHGTTFTFTVPGHIGQPAVPAAAPA